MELAKAPRLVASTNDVYCHSIEESRDRERDVLGGNVCVTVGHEEEVNYFKNAQWSPDGTSILTSNADDAIRTFIVPPNLLDEEQSCISLTPYTAHTFPTAINCFAPYPFFNLSEPTTTLYLSTLTDLPIRLTNCLSPSPSPVSAYPLISLTTEAYYTPSSIIWSRSGTNFLAGTDCLIALFDVSRNGGGPVSRMPTIPSKRHKLKGGGVGIRGIVSALSIQPTSAEGDAGSGMLAAGTWTRWVGLYDAEGMGGTVATWSIAEAADKAAYIGGSGITQTLWSACGRYLYVVERKSQGVLVYDVRVTGKLVAWLQGREADTNQRLAVDVFRADDGMEIWAGGTDGVVRVWQGVGKTEGVMKRSWEWYAHKDTVTSVMVHNSGTVVATSSGQRASLDSSSADDESDTHCEAEHEERSHIRELNRKTPDNRIKIWSI